MELNIAWKSSTLLEEQLNSTIEGQLESYVVAT